jgi:hypothetical protein
VGSERLCRWWARTVRQVGDMDGVTLGLQLTLLDLLLRPVGSWVLRPIILLLAAIGLLLPGQLRRPGLWGALTVLTGLRVVLDWPLADNHAYLLCYWCLAITLALIARDTPAWLALNGRLLIGGVFVFAMLWKLVLSPDYLDGRFMRVTMLTDSRFEYFTRLAGGLSRKRLDELRSFIEQHVDGSLVGSREAPLEPHRFRCLARFVTLWNLLLEGSVAVAFLWPLERGLSRRRDAFLLVFCATVYAVATVEGFGWLLLAMGTAQCADERRRTRLLYLAVFGLILVYREVPWTELLFEYVQTSNGVVTW